MPPAGTFPREVQLGPRIFLRCRFQHFLAVKAKLGNRQQTVGVDPCIRTADCTLHFAAPLSAEMRHFVQPQVSAARDETKARNQIEVTDELRRFVPRITNQPFVGAFTRKYNLLAATMHASRKLEQCSAGGVDYWRFRCSDKAWIRAERVFAAEILNDRRLGADMSRRKTCGIEFIHLR